MSLQLIVAAFPLNCRITPCLRIVQHHRLIENIKAVDFLNSAGCGVNVVKDNEGLALRLQVRLCDDL